MRPMRRLIVAAILITSCGGAAEAPATTTPTSQDPVAATTLAPTTTTPVSTTASAPLATYAFTMTLAVEDEYAALLPVAQLDGLATTHLGVVRITGETGAELIDLASDGSAWWDVTDPDLELSASDVELFLAFSGFLQPGDVEALLEDAAAWEELGTESILGVAATHLRRTGIAKDVDWDYGDVASLDVWSDSAGDVMRLVARWATGDNTGFPVSIWEMTERNPAVDVPQRP